MLFQALLPIFVEEELRIRQACAQNALIAVLHRLKILGSAISHGEEKRHQTAVRRLHGEVALMVAHRRNDGLRRQCEILFFKSARKRRRILDEIEHLFQKIRRDFRRAAVRLRLFGKPLLDQRLAPCRIDDDESLLARFLVMRGILDSEVARAEETMAARCIAALDARKLKGHDFLAVECDKPAQGPDKAKVEVAPAHAVGKGQAADELGQELFQHLFRRLSRFLYERIDVAITRHEILRLDALPASEAFRCFRRLARGIESHLYGRPSFFFRDIRLLFSQSFDDECEAARRAERPHSAMRQTQLAERLFRPFTKLLQQSRHCMCRNLLCADFQQQILAHAFAPFFSIG